jgi:3'-phosphoadenosine 5'-phosphosulfate sulfotransferase (PAPS reductase)/FAD synthetase
MQNIIRQAIRKGAVLFASISGGKDGQAMTKVLANNGFPITGFIHADLGTVEWEESMTMCELMAVEYNAPLHVVKRSDGAGLLELWERRMHQLQGQGKPFWSSSAARYCTSDTKRDPINVFLRNCGHDIVVSCEGIRAGESPKRAKKNPLEIRWGITSSYYKGMTVEQAIANFKPGKRLGLTWFPIFNFSTLEVFATYGNTQDQLEQYRQEYKITNTVNPNWRFHPAYVYGNERVSCVFCVLACGGDLATGAAHRPELLQTLIGMEQYSGFTFKQNFSLKSLVAA